MASLDYPHKRFNPLTGEWVLVSPHRSRRPWQGQIDQPDRNAGPAYDPNCYLCPGNTRANNEQNPDYRDVFAFTNDFPALLPEWPARAETVSDGLFVAVPETGLCRVICYSPRHDLSMARMDSRAMTRVVDLWCREYNELGNRPDIGYVQIFENRGSLMGCSNPHPHGQIWADRTVPVIPYLEETRQADHLARTGRCLLCEYLAAELERGERVILTNDSFVVLAPFWAIWPFEVLVLPREHLGAATQLSPDQRKDLADILIRLAIRYDNLFLTSFPYSMGMHQQSTDGDPHPEWHFHFHFYPPLLRSADIRKFMVGYELLAMPQRDLTVEDCAARLASQSEIHYLDQKF